MINLLAADEETLANEDALKVFLVISSFVPSLDLVLDDLDLATFTGSAAKLATVGEQQVFVDPTTNQEQIQILEPAGGWSWICTADPTLPETVYGWVLTDNAGTGLLGSGLLATPVTIASSGQGLSIPFLRFAFDESSPT